MGTSNSAANAAEQQTQEQQAAINGTISQIQSAFNSPSRREQAQNYGNQLLSYYTNTVNQQEAQNARNLKFAEARSGLTGGSAATDANTQLEKDYTQGLLNASQAAQTGQAQLEQSDIASENSLIGEAEQGGYIGSVPTAVATATQANVGAAQNAMNPTALGTLFAGTAGIYNNEQTAAANRAMQINPFGNVYGAQSPYASAGASVGGGNSIW